MADLSRLDRFLRANALKPAKIARAAGCSRQHLLRLRKDQMEPTSDLMVRIARACGDAIARRVFIAELFEINYSPRDDA